MRPPLSGPEVVVPRASYVSKVASLYALLFVDAVLNAVTDTSVLSLELVVFVTFLQARARARAKIPEHTARRGPPPPRPAAQPAIACTCLPRALRALRSRASAAPAALAVGQRRVQHNHTTIRLNPRSNPDPPLEPLVKPSPEPNPNPSPKP